MSVDVLTFHNDNAHTGANLGETTLTLTNVNSLTFGKTGQAAVDGAVYTQPLIKSNLLIPGKGFHNVVYAATEHDSVYAFDADTLAPLWRRAFINPALGVTAVSNDDVQSSDIGPEIGITGTPVIDPASKTLYVVTKIKITNAAGIGFDQQLHALDLATGAEKFGGPISIRATVPGNGDGSINGQVGFDPLKENQRSALTLSNGVVYVAFASYGDNMPYHGWVLGYDARTLKQTFVYNATAQGGGAGIWMSGSGLSVDQDGGLYFVTGNGTFTPPGPAGDLGDTVVKFRGPSAFQSATLADSFTPADQQILQDNDLDLGSGSILLLPDQPGAHPHLLITGDKAGRIYVLNRDGLGGYSPNDSQAVQEIPAAMKGILDAPAYFNGTVYFVGAGITNSGTAAITSPNTLRAYSLFNGRLNPTPTVGAATYGFPGATPSVSANGSLNGIVWTIDRGGQGGPGTGVLRAYLASNVGKELYNSNQAGTRDQGGGYVKFSVPTIANGKVFVGGQGTLTAYGPIPRAARNIVVRRPVVVRPVARPVVVRPVVVRPVARPVARPVVVRPVARPVVVRPVVVRPVVARPVARPVVVRPVARPVVVRPVARPVIRPTPGRFQTIRPIRV